MDTGKDLLVTSPLELIDWASLCLDAWHTFPTIAVCWALSCELFAFPHDNKSIFCTARNDSSLGVVFNRDDFVIEHLIFEGWFRQSENIVLIILNVEHSDHVLAGDGS
jgi:hypothetical protein